MKELEKIVDSNGEPLEIVDAEAREDISEIKQSLSQLDGLAVYRQVIPTGDTASFIANDSMSIIKVAANIEPQQNLHGYDSPWVGGAGKNKLPLILDNIKANNTSGTWNGNTYVHPNGITFNFITNNSGAIEKIVATGTALGNAVLLLDSTTFKPWTGTFIINGCIEGSGSTYFWDMQAETSGNVINYDGDTSFVPNQNYRPRIVIISGYQCPTNGITFKPMIRLASVQDATFAPYSNICPISGWDECNVTVCGSNVWDEEWELGSISLETGANINSNSIIRSKNYILVNPNTAYYHLGRLQLFFYDKDKNYISYLAFTNEGVFTTPSNAVYMRFTITSVYGTTYNHDISINYPSSDTSYHAYNGTTYTIDLDGTRYGGTLDVVSGLLTITDGYIASYNGETLSSTWISDRDVYTSGGTPTTGAQVVYKLASALSYQLTAQQINVLVGQNYIWADTGSIKEVGYLDILHLS